MIEYIYFVKCPNCDDEPFSFFDEAKEFALGCLGNKPIITQIEVCRNDFGECTDSKDLGTVWSWEDIENITDDEPAVSVFTRDDLEDLGEDDPEFAAIDNLLDFEPEPAVEPVPEPEQSSAEPTKLDDKPDNFRKPIPDGMTIEQLVEEMEENEDVVECTWCNELFDKSECRYEADMGWLCDRCVAAIKSRGEELTFKESLKETFNPKDFTEFDYDNLTILIQSDKYDVDRWDEKEITDSYTYRVSNDDVATDIWENFIADEDVLDVEGGLEALEDDGAWRAFLDSHFDSLLAKYYNQLLEYYRESATEEFESNYGWNEYQEDEYGDMVDRAYDEWRDRQFFGESKDTAKTSMLEDLEEPEDYRKRLTACPECGAESYDIETGICINCGFECYE